tara:strand:+ start:2195 stop:2710 length:516 start_codon:yes stop_codon:yes gene_type:complete
MKLLLLEGKIRMNDDFQKLLDNSNEIYGVSENEKISIITHDKVLFQEVNYNEKKDEYSIDYHYYVFFDVKKSIYRDLKNLNKSYFELSQHQNAYRSWSTSFPFLNNLRTDHDKCDNLSLVFLSFSYSKVFSQYDFTKNECDIYFDMESKLMSYAKSVVFEFNIILNEKTFN